MMCGRGVWSDCAGPHPFQNICAKREIWPDLEGCPTTLERWQNFFDGSLTIENIGVFRRKKAARVGGL